MFALILSIIFSANTSEDRSTGIELNFETSRPNLSRDTLKVVPPKKIESFKEFIQLDPKTIREVETPKDELKALVVNYDLNWL